MRLPHRSHFGSSAILVCLSAALLLSSCAKQKPQQAILGKWKVDENESVVEYRPDGTMVTSQNGQETVGKYKFIDDSHFEMEASASQGSKTLTLHLTCGLAIHGDKAELTTTIASNPPVTKTLHYTRVK